MSSLYSAGRGGCWHAPAIKPELSTERVMDKHSILFVILFVITGIFLLVLVSLVYFLFTGQNEEAKSVLSTFVVLLGFIVWRMMDRFGDKR